MYQRWMCALIRPLRWTLFKRHDSILVNLWVGPSSVSLEVSYLRNLKYLISKQRVTWTARREIICSLLILSTNSDDQMNTNHLDRADPILSKWRINGAVRHLRFVCPGHPGRHQGSKLSTPL